MAGAGGGRRSAGATPRGVRAGGLGRLHERTLRGGRALPSGCGVTPDPLRLPETLENSRDPQRHLETPRDLSRLPEAPGDPRELKRPPGDPREKPPRPLETSKDTWRPLETPMDTPGKPQELRRHLETLMGPLDSPQCVRPPPPPPSVGPFPHVR
ncbi:caskin-1-like isoform X1 [Ammospiza caudacuta]|uniref:caskin-1-like isoform X1 n=1 Tax=Ammospiza caudacuta TaxID=2857398 RepID=UPI0027397FEA|nr:caskin-1-like isoform X1 [Ammospiza caudacuta]